MRLDYWTALNKIGNIDFIWADVQGAEEDLILGGRQTLKRTRFFYTEYYDNECYAGQINLDKIYDLVNQFLILKKYKNDVLLENIFANKSLPANIITKFIENAENSGNFNLYCEQFGADLKFLRPSAS